jgi:hypothetical protein
MFSRYTRHVVALTLAIGCAATVFADGPESKRLIRAKDLIADEQWTRAIEELRLTVADKNENRRDEALYWLAHSLNQSGDSGAAVETISRLEREFPGSIWVKPAQSLRIEIAVRLGRSDVLWWFAAPPPPPAHAALPPAKMRPPDAPFPPPAMPASATKAAPPAPNVPPAAPPPLPPKPAQKMWLPESYAPDADLRIQAFNGLMKTDPVTVIPMLRDLALEADNPNDAGRALFVLAQSPLPQARASMVLVAQAGPMPVRVAAVKALGRVPNPEVSNDLMTVYVTALEPVKLQIVKSLGERAEKGPLLRIVQTEKDGKVRLTAITGLGQAGGAKQLAAMYKTVSIQSKKPIIVALFGARAEAELIRIAETEQNESLRQEALERLRLLGTPTAKAYLQKVSEKR